MKKYTNEMRNKYEGKVNFWMLLLIGLLIMMIPCKGQNVGIGTTTPQSILDVTSTTSGFLPPRMTSIQRDAIIPIMGTIIYCNDCVPPSFQGYTSIGWQSFSMVTPTNEEVIICNQVWKDKNLTTSVYRNGDSIPHVTDATIWASLTTGAYCYYNNDSTKGTLYGKLYNWYAVNDSRGLAPVGWHIPTSVEMTTLSTCLGGDALAGGALKEIGTNHWAAPNTGATNSSGFTGLPGGYRFSDGTFNTLTTYGYYWTSVETNSIQAWYRTTRYTQADFNLNFTSKNVGFSVRLVKD